MYRGVTIEQQRALHISGRSLDHSILPNSAIHRWKLDEGTGNTAVDSIGELDGDISDPQWVPKSNATGGYVLYFDGKYSIDYPTVPSILANDPFEESYSISITSFTEIPDEDTVIWSWDNDNVSGSISLGLEDGKFGWGQRSNGVEIEPADLPEPPLRIVGINSEGEFNLYVNGTDEHSYNGTNGPDSSGGDIMTIGRLQDRQGLFYDGQLDNPIIYNESLSEKKINQELRIQPWVGST